MTPTKNIFSVFQANVIFVDGGMTHFEELELYDVDNSEPFVRLF
jgi:hypothetical protein